MIVNSFLLTIFLFSSVPVAIIVSSRNIILFLISLVFFVYIPFVIPLAYIGVNASYNELFLWSSGLHLIVLSVFIVYAWIVAYRRKFLEGFLKNNIPFFINLIIALSVFLVTLSDAYVEEYISKWEYRNHIKVEHVFKKSEDNISINIQKKVRKIVNKALIPKYKKPKNTLLSVLNNKWMDKDKSWQEVNISDLEVDTVQFIKLRKILMKKPSSDYRYYFSMNDKYALVVLSSKDRNSLRVLFRFTFKDRWSLEELLTYDDFNIIKRNKFGDIKLTKLKEASYNIAISDFYKNEFERSVENFIEAKNEYEIFKSRVEYRFALLCIENFDEAYFPLDYRENKMYEIANIYNNIEGLEESKEVFSSFYKEGVFRRIEHIQNQVLGTLKHSECKKYIEVEDLYKVFIKKYLTQLMFTPYDDKGEIYKILKKDPLYDEMEYKRHKRDYLRGYVIKEVSRLYKKITEKSRTSGIRGFITKTSEAYFTYTNKYLSREEIKALLDNQELLDFIETQEEIIIRDRFLDTVKVDKHNLEMNEKFKHRANEFEERAKQLEKEIKRKKSFMIPSF
jgi:hypothetical protein